VHATFIDNETFRKRSTVLLYTARQASVPTEAVMNRQSAFDSVTPPQLPQKMDDNFSEALSATDDVKSPLRVHFLLDRTRKFASAASITSIVGGTVLLLCSLFWYLESVGTNFVHQWALMLVKLGIGVVTILILVFTLPWHLSRTTSANTTKESYDYSPWYRWALWANFLAIALDTFVATFSIWMWIRNYSIDFDSSRFDPTVAPAAAASIQYYIAAGNANAVSGVLFFSTLYTIWKNAYPEAARPVLPASAARGQQQA
jgi:hypothetical protein